VSADGLPPPGDFPAMLHRLTTPTSDPGGVRVAVPVRVDGELEPGGTWSSA
jgi:hypothetical protein